MTEEWTGQIEAGTSAVESLLGDDELVLTDAFEVTSIGDIGSELVSRMAIVAASARRAAAQRSMAGPAEVIAHRSVLDHSVAAAGEDRWLVSVVIIFELIVATQ